LTASRKAPAVSDRRIRGMKGPLNATKMNAGRNIPSVATIAPGVRPRMYPMNVAVVNTGPGVNWPDCYGVQKLSFAQPVPPLDQISPQKGEQHVSASKQYGNRSSERTRKRRKAETLSLALRTNDDLVKANNSPAPKRITSSLTPRKLRIARCRRKQ